MLKKYIFYIIIILAIFLSVKVSAKTANVYLFYGEGCPHCKEAHDYLNEAKEKYDINIYSYEVWYNDGNKKIMSDVSKYLDFNVRGVPLVIIDNIPISGFSKESTPQTYNYHIKIAQKEDFNDYVGVYLGVVDKNELKKDIKTTMKNNNNKKNTIKETILYGLKSAFNFCFIGPLLTIICILITLNKKDYLKVVLAYFVTNIIFYTLLIAFNIPYTKLILYVLLSRVIIILVSLILGLLNLNKFSKCLSNEINFDINKSKKELIYIFIFILLSLSSRLLEISCISQNINTLMNTLNGLKIHTLIYVLISLIDDLIIFMLIYFILNKFDFFNQKNKYIYLISSIILILLCAILIVKPGLLIFSF